MRTIRRIVIHTSDTEEGKDFRASDIDSWHREKGWSEIGYNYVVLIDGTMEEGRSIEKIPAHAYGYNRDSIGICYIGGRGKDGKSKDTRTDCQKEQLIAIIKQLKERFPTITEVVGHRDLPGVAKDCPCFDAKTEYANL